MLGRYRLEQRIGEGAMAEVHRAHDTAIDRVVAIKLLKADFRRDPEIGRRFLREAKAAGTLSHANIATIYDVGEADGVAYIAMELVEGRPLDEVLLAHGRMAPDRVLAIGAQLADALAFAHRHGVVHRDIKPSNILITTDGRTAKLLDFGVARIREAQGAEPDLARTQVGHVIGTPRYMSPEQALGIAVDHRSDLFSLGVVLYEMVTGKVAFAATGIATLALQIAGENPAPLGETARDCPRGLRFIIDKLLAKKPDQRFADAAQVHAALCRELDQRSADEPARRRGLPLRFKLPLALVAATALALGASIAAIVQREDGTLTRMAIVSGSSITSFVTSNAAVLVADNAGLPAEQQDWAPLQAFVDNAARDPGVRGLAVVDGSGTIRAASDHRLIGRRDAGQNDGRMIDVDAETGATVNDVGSGFRFAKPIRYAGASFGRVDLTLRRTALDGAMSDTRALLAALATIVMIVVLIVGWLSGSLVTRPLRRLRRALDDAATGRLEFRLSHRRHDEFGAAFDAFNRMADELAPHLQPGFDPTAAERAVTQTRVIVRKAA